MSSALARLDSRIVPLDVISLCDADTPDELRRLELRERALSAAVAVAAAQGLDASEARVLKDWNDTVVHLAPAPVVARVRTWWVTQAEPTERTYAREIAVARHVAAHGGPVVHPAASPGPFTHDGLTLALWDYVEVLPLEPSRHDVGLALRALHDALNSFAGELPLLDERLDRAGAVIADPSAVPRLGPGDRAFLEAAFHALRAEAAARSGPPRPLHGGAHGTNLLPTADGPRWIDLDTVCRGPLEWDLATVGEETAKLFPEHDPELLELIRRLVGAEVAIWCWHTYGRAPEVDEAAHYHLEALRRSPPG